MTFKDRAGGQLSVLKVRGPEGNVQATASWALSIG
jgi:hypothetical protein